MIKLTIQSIPPVAMLEVEAGSIPEAVAIFSEDGSSKVLGDFFQQVIAAAIGAQTNTRQLTIPASALSLGTLAAPPSDPNLAAEAEGGASDTVEEQGADGKPTRRRRTKVEMAAARAAAAKDTDASRLEAASAPAPAAPVAVAPAPMPIPALANAPPPLAVGAPGIQPPGFLKVVPDVNVEVLTNGGNGIPTILQRTAPPPPPVVPPPPALPSPPICNLGRKVSEHLKARGESPELLRWVLDSAVGLSAEGKPEKYISSGAKWEEVLDVLLFITDDKIRPIAGALQVA